MHIFSDILLQMKQTVKLVHLLLLQSVDSANETYCDDDKSPLFLFRPLHSSHPRPIRAQALDKPTYGSPIYTLRQATTRSTAPAPLLDQLFVSNSIDL